MHLLEFNRRRDSLLRATWAHEYMAIFVKKKIDGHRTWGGLEELEVCDFDKTWSACQ